jgi:uncharacterized protein (DUF2267 family)
LIQLLLPEEEAMSPTGFEPFDRATLAAGAWLTAVADELKTGDRELAYRILRTWLQTLRDRLPVRASATFAAQLPELLRGLYFEGWEPGRVPVKYGPDEYLLRFAHQARVPVDGVPAASAAVTAAVRAKLAPGKLAATLDRLPPAVRVVVAGEPADGTGAVRPGGPPDGADADRAAEPEQAAEPDRSAEAPPSGAAGARRVPVESVDSRIGALEDRISALSEAVGSLADGLGRIPPSGTRRPADTYPSREVDANR